MVVTYYNSGTVTSTTEKAKAACAQGYGGNSAGAGEYQAP
jgi:hypothetical protein